MPTVPPLNPVKLDILRELREAAQLTQIQAAKLCGLTSKQGRISLAAWEQGESVPRSSRRVKFMGYLWDHLGLRQEPERFEDVWAILIEEWRWEPVGDREWGRLTTVERPRPTNPDDSKPPDCSPRPFLAPATARHFVGRQDELDAACMLLTTDDGLSAVAFVGMGGIGKTTLAIHAAHALRYHFADGILWANTATTNPLDIAQSWALAYGYDFSGLSDLESRAAAIRNVLAEKHALIIFDDVIDAADVRPLLPGGETCRAIITTRNHDVASTLNAHLTAPPELTVYAAVDLLISVLGKARVNAELEAAQRICAIVEGLPLAVEIVAQRLLSRKQQSLGNMMGRLEDAAKRLDSLQISDKAVRTAFEVSWEQLNDVQKEVFSQMGVFEGRSFAIPALAYIGERAECEMEELIWELQALSLVGGDGDRWYRQHPLLADFAGEVADISTKMKCRLVEYYLGYVEECCSTDSSTEVDWNGVMFGMQVAYQSKMWHYLVRYVNTLGEQWILYSRYYEAHKGYLWAIEGARVLLDKKMIAKFQIGVGYVLAELGKFSEAKDFLTEGATNAYAAALTDLQADSHFHLARLAIEAGSYEEADELIGRCYSEYFSLDNKLGVARVQHLRALVLHRTREFQKSNSLCKKILPIQKEYEDSTGQLETLRLITDNFLFLRQHQEAKKYCYEAIRIAAHKNNAAELAESYINFAVLYRREKNYESAVLAAKKAIQISGDIGKLQSKANAYYECSLSLKYLKLYMMSVKMGEFSLKTIIDLKDDYSRVFCMNHLGEIYLRQGLARKGKVILGEALELAKQLHHPSLESIEAQLQTTTADL